MGGSIGWGRAGANKEEEVDAVVVVFGGVAVADDDDDDAFGDSLLLTAAVEAVEAVATAGDGDPEVTEGVFLSKLFGDGEDDAAETDPGDAELAMLFSFLVLL